MESDPRNTAFMQQLEVIGKGLQIFKKNIDTIVEALVPIAEVLVPIVLKAEQAFSQWDQYRAVFW